MKVFNEGKYLKILKNYGDARVDLIKLTETRILETIRKELKSYKANIGNIKKFCKHEMSRNCVYFDYKDNLKVFLFIQLIDFSEHYVYIVFQSEDGQTFEPKPETGEFEIIELDIGVEKFIDKCYKNIKPEIVKLRHKK